MSAGGQQWCCARQPNWYFRYNARRGLFEYQRRIVYCHTSQYKYPGYWTDEEGREHQSEAWCTLHNVAPSYDRCFRCPDNWGTSVMSRPEFPQPHPAVCDKRDHNYRGEDSTCRRCGQAVECRQVKLERKGAVYLLPESKKKRLFVIT